MKREHLEKELRYPLIEQNECWLFSGGSKNGFHGSLYYEGKSWQAHRLAYKLTHGHIDDQIKVLHRCDNGFCCNPKHLFLGTQQDNVSDMIEKGRDNFACVGINNGRATITEETVKEIRQMYSEGFTQKEICAKYNTTQNIVSKIVAYRTWRHI